MHVNALPEVGAQASFGELHWVAAHFSPVILMHQSKAFTVAVILKALLLCLGLAVEPILVIGHVSQGFLLRADRGCALSLPAAHALAESFGALAVVFSLRHRKCLVGKKSARQRGPTGARPASEPNGKHTTQWTCFHRIAGRTGQKRSQ